MSLQKTLTDIIKSSKEDPKDVFQKLVKLQEETGELADAALRRSGLKNPKNKTIEQLDEAVLEEIADVIMIVTALLPHFDFKIQDLTRALEFKYDKWQSKFDKYPKWKSNLERYREYQIGTENGYNQES